MVLLDLEEVEDDEEEALRRNIPNSEGRRGSEVLRTSSSCSSAFEATSSTNGSTARISSTERRSRFPGTKSRVSDSPSLFLSSL